MLANVDISNVVLETDRLIIRPWNEDDLNDFYEYAKVDGVGEMAGWHHHESIEESKNVLNIFIAGKKTFAIVYKENNKVIGSIGLEEFNNEKLLKSTKVGRDLGYALSKDYWGKGIMPEACNKVIDYVFNTLNYDFLTCGHFFYNMQSKRVQEKLGFKFLTEAIFTTRMGTKIKGTVNILYNKRKENN